MAPVAIHAPVSLWTLKPSIAESQTSMIKDIICDFLHRCGYQPHKTPPNKELRAAVMNTMLAWESGDSLKVIEPLTVAACDFTETAYGHTSLQHQNYIALYTLVLLYVDDVGGKRLEAIKQCASRFAQGIKQLCPALDTMVELLRQAHVLWTDVGADAIVSGTMDALTGMYIEYTTRDMVIKPQATWYPYYLRARSGICPPYIHFIFMKSWRPTTESYLQMLPYMERWIVGTNDILSFYKEQLAGETGNYMHMRASAEQTSVIEVLRAMVDEILDCTYKVEMLAAEDDNLLAIWQQYVQRALEYHVNTPRYRLSDLDLHLPTHDMGMGSVDHMLS